MKSLITILLLLLLNNIVDASENCCEGDNILINRTCKDGTKPKKPCESVYILHKSSDIDVMVDDHDNLLVGQASIPPNQYCVARFENASTDSYLICFNDYTEWKFSVYPIFGLISFVFIILTIFVYTQLPDLLDLQGICTLHSISGLSVTYLILAIVQLSPHINSYVCITTAYLMYFSSFYAFFWLNVLSFHIWRSAVKPQWTYQSWKLIYYAIGVGGPSFLFALLLIGHHSGSSYFINPGFGEHHCWFKSTETTIFYFYIPITILFCSNIIYFGWTTGVLWRDITRCEEKHTKILKFRFKLCIKLFIIMGVSWIFEVLSGILDQVNFIMDIFWIITDLINASQGILIFLILVVFRKRVIRGLANRTICGKSFPNRWKTLADDECDDIVEEFRLSEGMDKA